MQTKVEIIGLPNLSAILGAKTHIEWTGGTLAEMIAWLGDRHGPEVQQLLFDDQGRLDTSIQVMVNAKGFVSRDKIANHVLYEGDSVSLVLLAGGG